MLPLVEEDEKEAIATMVMGEAATYVGHRVAVSVRGGRRHRCQSS
jgi:hypothetical protein